MTVLPDRVWEVWILCFWWSSWTLADQWLIPFHPWSELVGLGLCAAVWIVFFWRGGLPSIQAKMNRELEQVTQTQGVGTYKRQQDDPS